MSGNSLAAIARVTKVLNMMVVMRKIRRRLAVRVEEFGVEDKGSSLRIPNAAGMWVYASWKQNGTNLRKRGSLSLLLLWLEDRLARPCTYDTAEISLMSARHIIMSYEEPTKTPSLNKYCNIAKTFATRLGVISSHEMTTNMYHGVARASIKARYERVILRALYICPLLESRYAVVADRTKYIPA
jgi:hypothetical protein